MTHAEFVAAYQSGKLRANIDHKLAGRWVSARMLLPFLLLPIFGAAVALALNRAWPWAIGALVLAFGLRGLVRASAPGFVLKQALASETAYQELTANGIIKP
jgi:hypothetical protein